MNGKTRGVLSIATVIVMVTVAFSATVAVAPKASALELSRMSDPSVSPGTVNSGQEFIIKAQLTDWLHVPISGQQVFLWEGGLTLLGTRVPDTQVLSTTTDANGYATFTRSRTEAGMWWYDCSWLGNAQYSGAKNEYSGTVDVSGWPISITIQAPSTAAAGQSFDISGRLTRTDTGAGFAGVELFLHRRGLDGQWHVVVGSTVANGYYRFPRTEAAGTYQYYVDHIWANPWVYNAGASATKTVSVTPGPIADAGPNQNVQVGMKVTLDGSKSSDPGHHPFTYAWTLSTKPAGSTATLSGPTTVKPYFTPDKKGTYVATLIVKNSLGTSSKPDTVTITVLPKLLIIYYWHYEP